ncbi:MAG: hypothetical protein KF767_09005 [Bdellovibrionaceae bacterium]|nr:hypothetical protein [Pseudobdellovibrionaceae bacterium]
MKPGKYIAKVYEANVSKTKAGDPRPYIIFRTEAGEDYQMGFSLKTEKGQEIAMKHALMIGYDGARGWAGFSTLAVDTKKDWEIDVRERSHDGKKYLEVKYVNNPRKANVMSSDEIAVMTAGSADKFAAYRIQNNITVSKPSSDDIPF